MFPFLFWKHCSWQRQTLHSFDIQPGINSRMKVSKTQGKKEFFCQKYNIAFFVLWLYVLTMPYNAPKDFMLCQNVSCSKADSCLRSLCYKELTLETVSVNVLNPALYPEKNEDCPYYKTTDFKGY